MGKTLAGVKIPKTVIIIDPNTRPGPRRFRGQPRAWQIPGATIPVAKRSRSACAGPFPRSPASPRPIAGARHRSAAAVPAASAPGYAIVPIALGPCAPETLAALARELGRDPQPRPAPAARKRPLLVISSDMNHFAPEAENRRRDMLASRPCGPATRRQLYETCMNNDISMCGVFPAITVMQALLHETPALQPRLVDYSTSAAASGGCRARGRLRRRRDRINPRPCPADMHSIPYV